MEIDESKRVTAFELEELPYFRKIFEKSPLKRFESPTLDKKFVAESQKNVIPSSIGSQQVIQRHNFLLPKDEPHSAQSYSYRGVDHKKSKSPFVGESSKNDSSVNQYDSRRFSSDKRNFGFGK